MRLCWLILFIPLITLGQQKFTDEMLEKPTRHKKEIESAFHWITTPQFTNNSPNALLLKNGYALASFIHPEKYRGISSKVDTIDIIFTMYPKRKSAWRYGYHKLLADRIKAIIKLDSTLNDEHVVWRAIGQNNCRTEEEAKMMFHGVRFIYSKKEIEKLPVKKTDTTISSFIERIGGIRDSTVYNVLLQSKIEKNALLVIDWTSSMYQYGLQILQWHVKQGKNSPFIGLVLFNDGNQNANNQKVPGKTGGVYISDITSQEKLIKLMKTVMNAGTGGDNPENDVEAILEGISSYPDVSQVILIADNNACMRDIALVSHINKPVYAIMCGVLNGVVNPQYVQLAYKTNGGIFTESHLHTEITVDANNSVWINGKKFMLRSDGKFTVADPSDLPASLRCP